MWNAKKWNAKKWNAKKWNAKKWIVVIILWITFFFDNMPIFKDFNMPLFDMLYWPLKLYDMYN